MDEHATFETQAVLAPRRRRNDALAALVAGVAVALLVGAGVLGGLDSKVAPPPAASEAAAGAPSAADVATPSPTAEPQPAYPADVFGLQVWSAAYVSRYGMAYFGGSIAVAGWYAAQPGTGCPTPRIGEDPALAQEFGVAADSNTFCRRAGALFTAPMFDENVTPIDVTLRPGVAAPYQLKDGGVVTPVVFIGKLAMSGPECHAPDTCPRQLVVDQVAWAAGAGVPRTESILPRLLDHWPPVSATTRDQATTRAIGYQATVLMETLVDPAMLAQIDPYAAKVLAAAAPKANRIWYRRVLGPDPEQDSMRWITIDDTTGEFIAGGTGA
ncbi:MAG TPA: hypothetical protein VJ850_01975 [Candidatus Limnocylindrales bacterium]|nr:hypothetical protein [Candidatus Limnocylindrales bacterium]